MDEFVAWLLEQVAEDENAIHTMIGKGPTGEFLMSHRAVQTSIIEADSSTEAARFRLAECEAKRLIIAEHTTLHTVVDGFCVEEGGECTHAGEAQCQWCGTEGCRTLRLVALPYADRPGYREEWKP